MIQKPTNDFDRDRFATLSLLCFLFLCVCVLALIARELKLEAWAAGIIGSILGFWAGNMSQVYSYRYGSSQSNQANRETINKMIDTSNETAKTLAAKVPVTAVVTPATPLGTSQEPVAVVPVAPQEVEVANLAALPQPGEASKVYVLKDTGKRMRWNGTDYAEETPT